MKKAYVRTEIFKFLNKIEKENGKPLAVQDIFNLAPKMYEYLKSEPENQLQALTFDEFNQLLYLGYQTARTNAQFGF